LRERRVYICLTLICKIRWPGSFGGQNMQSNLGTTESGKEFGWKAVLLSDNIKLKLLINERVKRVIRFIRKCSK